MVVIEGLKNGPVKGEVCTLTIYGEGGVIQHFEDKSVIVGKWHSVRDMGQRFVDVNLVNSFLHSMFHQFHGNTKKYPKKTLEQYFDAILDPQVIPTFSQYMDEELELFADDEFDEFDEFADEEFEWEASDVE